MVALVAARRVALVDIIGGEHYCVLPPAAPDRPTAATHVTIGAGGEFDTYLAKNLGGGPAGGWPVKKSARIGDRVVILIPSMHGDLRAYGTVASDPKTGKWGKSDRFFVKVDELHEISPPVPIELVRQSFPDWKWAGYARQYTTVPD